VKKRQEGKEATQSSYSGQEPQADGSVHDIKKFKKRPNPFLSAAV
jgi:hypothetical protein